MREVEEETGIVVGSAAAPRAALRDWGLRNVYEIYPVWRHRYAAGVTHNTERALPNRGVVGDEFADVVDQEGHHPSIIGMRTPRSRATSRACS